MPRRRKRSSRVDRRRQEAGVGIRTYGRRSRVYRSDPLESVYRSIRRRTPARRDTTKSKLLKPVIVLSETKTKTLVKKASDAGYKPVVTNRKNCIKSRKFKKEMMRKIAAQKKKGGKGALANWRKKRKETNVYHVC